MRNIQESNHIIDKLRALIIKCVEDFNPEYIKEIKDIGLNTYNVKVKESFFIDSFNRYNNDFELQEIYPQKDWNNVILSIYVKYIGE